MSNNYASYYIPPSAVQYNNYVCAQTTGPLSSAQTPNQLGYHSYGVLNGVHPKDATAKSIRREEPRFSFANREPR